MAQLLREFHKGGLYHVVNRGVMKQDIFRGKDDYNFYLYRLKETLKKFPVNIHAYNLLTNHIHYLIQQISKIVSPDKFIASCHTSLSLYINKKYSRVGHLFQGRPKIRPITDDDYLLEVSFYINLNKILEKLQRFDKNIVISKLDLEKLLNEAERDPWSSYPVYLGLRDDGITKPEFILSILSDDVKKARKEYKKMAREFITSGHFLKTRGLIFEGEK